MYMKVLTNLFIFAVGAAIGSAVTWKLVKTKYERIAREEIDSVKEMVSKRINNDSVTKSFDKLKKDIHDKIDDALNTESTKKDTSTNESIIKENNYTNYANVKKEEKGEDDNMCKPYVIPPDEFGDCDYELETLTLYADGVLTDDMDIPIEDVDSLVGVESLDHFGEWEDDSVFVRNDELKTDYEILLDLRNYSDVEKG